MPETQAPSPPPDILDRIVETKRREIADLRARSGEVRRAASAAPPPRDFEAALRRPSEVGLIAEVKRRSPGAGAIRPGLDPVELARGYAEAGAAAVSVLTDREYFGGSLDDLRTVKGAVEVPVLRKDFTLDEIQVAEARGAGADAVLLIVRILDDERLAALVEAARAHGLAALVEVHDGGELERALAAGATLVGVNNRNLRNFTTDLGVTEALLERIPAGVAVVSESGIRTPAEVERLGARGVDAVLVGESLLRSESPAGHAARLAGRPRTPRKERHP